MEASGRNGRNRVREADRKGRQWKIEAKGNEKKEQGSKAEDYHRPLAELGPAAVEKKQRWKNSQREMRKAQRQREHRFSLQKIAQEKRELGFHIEGKNPQIPSIMSQPVVDLSQFDISKEEKDKLVAEVIRYVLFKTHHSSGCPIKREELTQLLTKNYRLRNLPTIIINEAIQKLSAIFGYEMQELQRSRPSSANQGRLSQQSAVEAKSYIITTDLWRNLRRMGLDESNENHPVLGNIKQALDTLVQQRYLQKDKVSGPEGNTLFYELGERALDAPFSESTKAHISEICGGLALLGSRLWRISLEVVKLQVEMSQSSKKSQPEDFVSRIIVGSVYVCTASSG